MSQFLLELFSEEIPARFQKQAADDLKLIFEEQLGKHGVSPTSIQTHVTPRRLALVADIPARIAACKSSRKGPKADAAENIIAAFKQRLAANETIETEETPKGTVLVAVSTTPETNTADILPAVIDATIRALPWKKSQTWGETTFRWVRPLHSILAVFDGQRLDGSFDLGGGAPTIQFTDHTQGHRFMSSGSFAVANFADYQAKLRDAGVILDREERKQIIITESKKLLAEKGVTLKEDDGLLEEVCGLVEYPVPLLGRIDDQFMDIPAEVMVTTMRSNQKYFASHDANGKMSPWFVITANIVTEDKGAAIIAGNQRVLRARLSDARFFWDLDKAARLESRLSQLKDITFHAKLGSLEDRVNRIVEIATNLNIPNANVSDVRQAAHLCKADLVTGMVGEFLELQGIMGSYYAKNDGYGDTIATAIKEHYSPLGPTDKCPSAPVSVAVALAEKLDTLVGFFGIDEKPTGSKDPYALRRAALAVLRLIIENKLRLDLKALLQSTYKVYEGKLTVAEADTIEALLTFFADRLKVMLKDKGYRHDVIAAVIHAGSLSDITGQLGKLDALQAALSTPDGSALLALYKRATNILRIEEKKDGKTYQASATLSHLVEDSEKALLSALNQTTSTVEQLVSAENYSDAMKALVTLRSPIDAFFTAVMVNNDDAALRADRLSLLAYVRDVAHKLADFSQLEGETAPDKAKAA